MSYLLYFSLKKLPESKIPLHEAYCFRNVKPCKKCHQMVDKKDLESHEAEQHTQVIFRISNKIMYFYCIFASIYFFNIFSQYSKKNHENLYFFKKKQ